MATSQSITLPGSPSSLTTFLHALTDRLCSVGECPHPGHCCAECGRRVCREHSEKCVDCGQRHCEDCSSMHAVYCEKAQGDFAGSGSDPVHDVARALVAEVQQ